MLRQLSALFFAALIATPFITSRAQTPAPIIIQAVTTTAAASPTPVPAASVNTQSDPRSALQLLQEMQTTNAATIKKQEAALEAIDALQKAAEEIKVFSKRG